MQQQPQKREKQTLGLIIYKRHVLGFEGYIESTRCIQEQP